ncbi:MULTISPECIES: VOC family protein [Oerskovia]|jgi:predicted lactoylglutathione lyase|uniref:VOC family protein n=1 Tax=Oerskovia merdavium TaxID=2762227 RepID=A0ABR8U2L1_9CELL|nr:VOC family protein [Oerskovia merdavium]MBD7982262.1 VOC family protein [Oerskovia merdavium]
MAGTQIFVNLPVSDLEKSKAFYTQLGFSINEQFTDENASCVVISDTIYVMLLTHEFFRRFTPKSIVDAQGATEAINAISAESRTGVDDLADRALAAGGAQTNPPQDEGFMYSRSFSDLDGHLWEVMYMDPSTIEG